MIMQHMNQSHKSKLLIRFPNNKSITKIKSNACSAKIKFENYYYYNSIINWLLCQALGDKVKLWREREGKKEREEKKERMEIGNNANCTKFNIEIFVFKTKKNERIHEIITSN